MGSKKPSKRVVQFLFTSRHTVPTSIPSSNYSPNLRRSCVKLPHILSRMPHSPSGASARPSPHVSIKSLELNALHISQIQDMVHLNGNRSRHRLIGRSQLSESGHSRHSQLAPKSTFVRCWSNRRQNLVPSVCPRSANRDRCTAANSVLIRSLRRHGDQCMGNIISSSLWFSYSQ